MSSGGTIVYLCRVPSLNTFPFQKEINVFKLAHKVVDFHKAFFLNTSLALANLL